MRTDTNKRSPKVPRVIPFRRACADSGYAYTSMRDAHFRGEIAVVRVGRSWYVTEEELQRFTEANTVMQSA